MGTNNDILCPVCNSIITEKPKSSFITGSKAYKCNKCDFEGSLPLNTSMKIFWSTVTVLVSYILLTMLLGEKGSIGWLGVVGPLTLFGNWKNEKKITSLRTEKGYDKNPIDPAKEKQEVNKGIIYSVLIIALTFGLGLLMNLK